MKQRTIQILYGYWNEVRAGRLAPRRLEIEPSRIAGILPETFMLERTEANAFPFRLAGTRLCETFGWELRGTDFLSGWSEQDRASLSRQLITACEQGAAVLFTVEATADNLHRVELEAIVLPLIHTGSTIGRLVGAMSATTSPHWLGSLRLDKKRLARCELIWPDGRPHSLVERAGWRAPFAPSLSEARTAKEDRRNFRVLDGGLGRPKEEKH
jgi:hypothetical protein